MALRSATSFDVSFNDDDIRARKIIKAGAIDTALDNQDLALTESRLIVLDSFLSGRGVDTSYETVVDATAFLGHDLGGSAASLNATLYVYAFGDASVTSFDIKATINAVAYTLNVASGIATPTWHRVSTAVVLNADHTEESILIELKKTGGVGSLTFYVLGYALFG